MAGYYALLGRGPSLLDIAQASGMSRVQREQRDMQREQMAVQADAQKFDREIRVAELDQNRANYEARMNEERLKREEALAGKERERVANVRSTYAGFLEHGGMSPEQAIAGLKQQNAMEGLDTVDSTVSEDPRQALLTQLRGSSSGVLGPPKPEDNETVAFSRQLEAAGLPAGSAQHQAMMRRFNEAQIRKMEREPKGGMVINMPGAGGPAVGLTTGQAGAVQGEVMTADKSLAQMDRIDRLVADAGGAGELASMWERGKAKVGSVVSNTPLGGDVDKEKLRRRRTAESAIATFRNTIYSKLSGAAISDSERERLMESVPDVGDSEADFAAKMSAWRENLAYERQYGMDALLKGISSGATHGATGTVSETELDAAFDKYFPEGQ